MNMKERNILKVEDLVDFLQCPKHYKLERIVKSQNTKQNQIFCQVLKKLSYALGQHASWKELQLEIEEFFDHSFFEEWFELKWQKKEAIRRYLFTAKRLYEWLTLYVLCYDLCAINEELFVDINIAQVGEKITPFSLCPSLIVKTDSNHIWGILLCWKFSKPYTYHTRKAEHSVYHTIELLCMMEGLKKKYPDKSVKVSFIQAVSRRDTAINFADFDKIPGDNVISFTDEELELVKGKRIQDIIREVLTIPYSMSCKSCEYKNICSVSPNPIFTKTSEKGNIVPCEYTLNQKKVIEHMDGPLRVCAGPGGGKTATLVARMQNLIEHGVLPEHILAVTFTQKAAKEIEERILFEEKPVISTIHALAFQIIKQHECLIGRKKLVNKMDCKRLLLQILNYSPIIRGADYEKLTEPGRLLDKILNDFVFINRFGEVRFLQENPNKDAQAIILIKKIYDQKFQLAGYIHFTDQICLAVKLLEKYSGVRTKIQESYEYILIDEVQDIDEMQSNFIRLLVKKSQGNIAIFGDADQTIYGFRGGSNQFMLNFLDEFPGTVDVWLNDNFRSSIEIMNIANSLISHNRERVPLYMDAHFETGYLPELISNFSVNRIGHLVEDILKQGYVRDDIAIIARTNKELLSVCEILDAYNEEHLSEETIIYSRPKYYLYQDPIFQVILDLLCIHLGKLEDDFVWYRLLTTLKVTVEKKDSNKCIYHDWIDRSLIYPFEGEEASRYFTVSAQDDLLKQAVAKIYRASMLFTLPLQSALTQVIACIYDDNVVYEAIEILNAAIQERRIQTAAELWKYMDSISRFQDDIRISDNTTKRDQIHLMTAHDSKGKEFKVVIVHGVDEFEYENLQEERRLFYVALTRAKERLFLTELCKGKSTFIREIDTHLIRKDESRYA